MLWPQTPRWQPTHGSSQSCDCCCRDDIGCEAPFLLLMDSQQEISLSSQEVPTQFGALFWALKNYYLIESSQEPFEVNHHLCFHSESKIQCLLHARHCSNCFIYTGWSCLILMERYYYYHPYPTVKEMKCGKMKPAQAHTFGNWWLLGFEPKQSGLRKHTYLLTTLGSHLPFPL